MKKLSKLTYLRLCLSGAIAGVATIGMLTQLTGISTIPMQDMVGSLIGAASVAIGFKLAGWAWKLIRIDGNPFDIATIVVALLTCLIKPVKRAIRKRSACFTLRDLTFDFLNGTVIVPFLLLNGSTFSKVLLQEAIETNKLFFAIGGVIGLLIVSREYLNEN